MRSLLIILLAGILTSACTFEEAKTKAWKVIDVLLGKEEKAAPEAERKETIDLYSSPEAKNAKRNAEILAEMHRVVFVQAANDVRDFGDWADTLNQGASLEGVYNGFTHSSDYRQLESQNPGASPRALQLFGTELARLTLELPKPTQFDRSAAQPLPTPVEPEYVPDGTEDDNVLDFGTAEERKKEQRAEAKSKLDPNALAKNYATLFVGASIYTLKRVLADEALKVMELKAAYPEKFALWYSQWVAHVARYGVDFGLKLRNRSEEKFHYEWAVKADKDLLRWEVLNRLHRLLNEANSQG